VKRSLARVVEGGRSLLFGFFETNTPGTIFQNLQVKSESIILPFPVDILGLREESDVLIHPG
jgi:hypothetical protein